MELDRSELISMIAYVVAQNRRMLVGRKIREIDSEVLAGKIVSHLELCRVKCEQLPPREPHKTP
ncbi:MAG: hypothetical protein WC718_18685 [Phycisphaerales bacterium]|jgi:hypothetical protein